MTRTESPAAASRRSTAAEATGCHCRCRREVEAEDVEREREVEASEGLFQEADAAGEEKKRLRGREAEADAAAAVVASSMAAAPSGVKQLACDIVCGGDDEVRGLGSWEEDKPIIATVLENKSISGASTLFFSRAVSTFCAFILGSNSSNSLYLQLILLIR